MTDDKTKDNKDDIIDAAEENETVVYRKDIKVTVGATAAVIAQSLPPLATIKSKPTIEGEYRPKPNNATTLLVSKALNNPARIGSTKQGQIEQLQDYLTKDTIVTYKSKDATLTLTLERTRELFLKRIQNGAKVFNFLLQKLNEQNMGEITTFQLQELVDAGIYANKESAYKGLKKVTDKMMSIYIEGSVTKYEGRKKQEVSNAKAVLVSQRDISFNQCKISLPPIIREATFYITLLPTWSYRLNENSFMLLDYIFYLARQNASKIIKDGHFNIKLESIRIHLGLPTPEEAGKDPKRLIFEPIEKAIEEIEDARKDTNIKITPYYDHNYKHISEYLDGYIQIELDQQAYDYMNQISQRQEKKYKESKNLKKQLESKRLKSNSQ